MDAAVRQSIGFGAQKTRYPYLFLNTNPRGLFRHCVDSLKKKLKTSHEKRKGEGSAVGGLFEAKGAQSARGRLSLPRCQSSLLGLLFGNYLFAAIANIEKGDPKALKHEWSRPSIFSQLSRCEYHYRIDSGRPEKLPNLRYREATNRTPFQLSTNSSIDKTLATPLYQSVGQVE